MRILFLTHFYPPEMGAAGARMHGLARWLREWGNEITILTGFPNYPTGVIPKSYRNKLLVSEQFEGVDVFRTWVYASTHQTSLKRLVNYFSFVFSSILAGLYIRRKYDVIFVSSPPLFIGIAGFILSKIMRIPFVFDLRDLWPDVAIETGMFSNNSIGIKLSRKLADSLYRSADHLTPVTQSKFERLKSTNICSDKITVVTNGVDFDRLQSSTDINWREKLDLTEKFIITYTGLIGVAQGIGVAVDAASKLIHINDIHFVIVGEGVERKQVVAKAKALKLENITFLPRQPREAIPSLIATSDIVLVPLVSEALTDAVPSKLIEALACRRPVILAAAGEAADIVRESDGGRVIPPGNEQALADTIVELYDNKAQLVQYGAAGYEFVKMHYDRKNIAQKLNKVFRRVLQGNIK